MTCYRCKSIMIPCGPLRFHAALTTSDPLQHLDAQQCPCCGNYEDKQVVRNRENGAFAWTKK